MKRKKDQGGGFVDNNLEYFTTMPSIGIIGLIVGFPTFYLFWESLHIHRALRQQFEFTGLGNFVKMFGDEVFLQVFANTAIFTVGNVVIAFVVALLLAYCLSNIVRLKGLFIGIILLPWTIPPVSSAVLWGWMLDKLYGAVNIILLNLGFQKIFFLGEGPSAMMSIIVADAWIRIPLSVLVLYAGLQRVPISLIEAALIDGANAWQSFWRITFNFIRPEVSMVLILLTMFAWREFSLPWTLTGGGPENLTELFGITIFKQANLYLRYGYAASIGMFVLIITIFLAFFLFRIRSKEDG